MRRQCAGRFQHAARRQVSGRRAATAALLRTLLVVGLLASTGASAAAAEAISSTPSSTRPYYVCPPVKPRAPRCVSIVVPRSAATGRHSRPMPAGGSGEGGSITPADLQSAYRLPSSTNGRGQTVAVVYFGDDPNAEADLETYRSFYRLPACTRASGCFRKVNENGEERPLPLASRSAATEISLDLDMISATCPNCHLLLIEARSENLLRAIREAPRYGATVISNSWIYTGGEWREEGNNDRSLQIPLVPITFPTGDNAEREASKYPSASPYVIAVGGTNLERAENARGWTERAYELSVATCSRYEPKPLWQTDSLCERRAYADVSAAAVGLSVYDTYLSTGWQRQNGTSASSAIVAGVLALAEETTRQRRAGAFYDDPSGLFDVTTGRTWACETYFCRAGTGYDGPTGLGTPNGAPQVTAPTEPASSSIWAVRDTTDDQYLYYAGTEEALTESRWTPLTGWSLPEAIGGTVAAGSIPTAVRDPSSNSRWVYYVDRATNRIAFSTWTAREGWRNTVLGGTEAATGSSPTAVLDTATGNQYVYYVARGGAISSWRLEARSGWVNSTLGGSAAANTSPTVIRNPGTGFQNVFYIDARERSLAAFGGTPPGSWSNMIFGGRVAAANSSPAAVINPTTTNEQVYYVASETTIAIWSWTPSGGWVNNNVGGSAAANTSPSVVLDAPTTITNVFYVDSRRALAAFGGTPPGSWSNQIFGGLAAIGTSPVGIRDSSTGANWLWYTDSATGHRAYWAWSFGAGWSGFVL